MTKTKKYDSKDKILRCSICNKKLDFYLHECKRAVQEYLGCKTCDDWCTSCNPDWHKHDINQATMAE